jgi:hypothetical protein
LEALVELGGGAAAQLEALPRLLLEGDERLLVPVLGTAVVDDDVGGARDRERGHDEDRHQRDDATENEPLAPTPQHAALG